MTSARFGRHRTRSTPQQHAAAVTEPDTALARDEAAIALARDTVALLHEAVALLGEVAARNEAAAEVADDALTGWVRAPLPVAHALIDANRLLAAAARGNEPPL